MSAPGQRQCESARIAGCGPKAKPMQQNGNGQAAGRPALLAARRTAPCMPIRDETILRAQQG